MSLDFSIWLEKTKRDLSAAGVSDTPRLDVDLLVAHALQTDRGGLLLRKGGVITEDEARRAEALVRRRSLKEPVAYITGYKEFYSLSFQVTRDTLIPRPDSECLVDAALAALASKERGASPYYPLYVLDVGTGSGCLLLSVLANFSTAFGVGVDTSRRALHVAAGNAASISSSVDKRSVWCVGDMSTCLDSDSFHVVLANPPYVSTEEALSDDVKLYEPSAALFAGKDGLDAYRRWLPEIYRVLRSGGVALVEFGIGQDVEIAAMAKWHGLHILGVINDLSGRIRGLRLTKGVC